MPTQELRTRDLAKLVANDVAESYGTAITEDPHLDPYAKANARLGLAISQILANVAIDAIADWAEED